MQSNLPDLQLWANNAQSKEIQKNNISLCAKIFTFVSMTQIFFVLVYINNSPSLHIPNSQMIQWMHNLKLPTPIIDSELTFSTVISSCCKAYFCF